MSVWVKKAFHELSTTLVVAFVVAGIGWAIAKSQFIEQAAKLPKGLILTYVITFLAVILFDLYRNISSPRHVRSAGVLGGATFIAIAFLGAVVMVVVSDSDSNQISGQLSYPFFALIGMLLVRGFWEIQRQDWERPIESIGFAVSGILISGDGEHAKFVLVRNTNLRDGAGLWVPPGGHYDPKKKEPFLALQEKIVSEIGCECTQINLNGKSELFDHHTSLAKAYAAPIFYLREELQGDCKEHHSVHIAAVFACKVKDGPSGANAKYKAQDRIYVSVTQCATEFEKAKLAVFQAVNEWSRGKTGKVPGAYPDVLDDVPWRLHVVAKLMANL